MSEKIQQNEEPFKEKLDNTWHSGVIKSLKSHPGKFVRQWNVDDFEKKKLDEEEIKKQLDKNIANFKEGINDIRELNEHYGIALPTFEFVLGKKSNDRINMFTVIDKIEGESLEQIKKFSPEAKDKLDTFYSSMAQYYFDKLKNGGSYFWDFKNQQFVYGHKKGEKENKIYMVDIEPRSDESDNEGNALGILGRLSDVLDDAFLTESKFEEMVRFNKTTNTFKQNLNEISYDENSYNIKKRVEFLKNRLRDYDENAKLDFRTKN